jgi:four helix bundle protein
MKFDFVCELFCVFLLPSAFSLQSKGLIGMRRAAVSVPSNIVEGCARDSEADYLRFLNMAFGSLRELHYQLSLSKRLGFLSNENSSLIETKVVGAEKVLNGLIRSLRSIS